MNAQGTARKPSWLNKKIDLAKCREVEELISGLGLNTVCRNASCPNIGECFAKKHATFLILGSLCTRGCRFCGVAKRTPLAVDPGEPERVAEAASRLGLRHVVITSVTRDDLPDGGSGVFSDTVRALRKRLNGARVELLIPDFLGDEGAIKNVAASGPDIIGHNVETVPSLYREVRAGASYGRSLAVLEMIKKADGSILTKSGLMLGLGEKEEEVLEVFSDLRRAACDLLSLGQYLRPSMAHYPVKEYLPPQKFEYYKERALKAGFRFVASAPYVRSSYLADEYMDPER